MIIELFADVQHLADAGHLFDSIPSGWKTQSVFTDVPHFEMEVWHI